MEMKIGRDDGNLSDDFQSLFLQRSRLVVVGIRVEAAKS